MGARPPSAPLPGDARRESLPAVDFVLISERGDAAGAHWSQPWCAAVAMAVRRQGAAVSWLCALAPDEPAPRPPDGASLVCVRGRTPPFAKVEARVSDVEMDRCLARTLRPLGRAKVVHAGFGAGGSTTTLWVAERMGASPFAALAAREALCHRQSLQHAGGGACVQFEDAERCARCACAPAAPGLSPLQARAASLLMPLGGRSPFPNALAMQNRLDLVLGSLLVSTSVVAEAAEAAMLTRAGVAPHRACAVGAGDGAGPDPLAVAAMLLATG